MKKHFMKYSLMLFSAFMMWCGVSENVNAEEAGAHCYPSEEQIQIFKEDGTWEERQAYVKNLNYSKPSQELLYNAIQREHGFSTYAAGDDIPYDRKGMQVTGDAKLLLVRVEFADVKFENSKNYTEQEFYNMVMGNTSTGTFPYESLNAYYKRSSYNKLNITSDKVYSCTLSKNREEYEGEFDGEQDLIKEVLTLLDENVDFNNYDANQDGQIDGICINFAGENTDWGSTWWSHKFNFLDNSIQFDNVTPAGYIFQETHNKNDSSGTQTLIHETGHLLGLPDYYGQWSDGIGATDMMKDNRGDHNGFSKWLLGWIEEKNILKITKADGDTKVELSPLASEVIGDQPLIAVIAPEDTSIYSEYFVVQYDEYMGNQSFYELEDPGYRVFHVDAQLNDDGTNFEHDNIYEYNNHYLIRAVPIIEDENGTLRYYYINGDQLTPDTNESSAFYGGNILGFTGIAMTDFVTGDSPSFNVSFREKEALDGKLELQIEDMAFDSIITAIQGGKVDIGVAGMTVTEDRLKNVNFTDSYATGVQVIIVKNDSPITTVDDLFAKGSNHKIGVQTGTTGDIYCTEDIEEENLGTVERYNKGADAVQSLLTDKIDCVVIDNEPAKEFVKANEGLKILDTEYIKEDYAIAIAKDNDKLTDSINEALKELIADGTVQEILDRYIKAE